MAALEKGQSAVAVASGAAAVLMTVMALAKAGDNIISSSKIYNGTFTQFKRLLPSFGVTTKFVDPSLINLQEMIDKNTKLVFCESVANPDFSVANYTYMAQIAHDAGIPVVVSVAYALFDIRDNTHCLQVDATFTAAGFFGNPIDFGVDIVVHSATKWISGHRTTFGGVVVDSGKFDWSFDAARFPQFHTVQGIVDQQSPVTFWNRFGSRAFTAYLKYNLQRDIGSTLSPFSAQQLLIGLETLSLRCERQVKNAATLAKWLRSQQQVAWVAYIGFEDHPAHEMARRYLTNGFCSVLAFGLVGGQPAAFRLIDGFKLIVNSSKYVNTTKSCGLVLTMNSVGDSKTIVGHPWSTTHMSMTVKERMSCGVTDDLIRISAGTENVEDIIDDICQSLDKLGGSQRLSNGNVESRVIRN